MGIGEFPTGEKHEGGLKEILVALGLVAAAVGGTAVLKKYDLGMDDISATIAYLEAKAFGTSSEIITTDSLQSLAPIPAPTVIANGSAVATPQATAIINYEHYYDEDLKVGIMIEKYDEYPLFANNVTRMLDLMKQKTPERYKEAMAVYKQKPKKIVRTTENYNYNSKDEIGLSGGIESGGGLGMMGFNAYLYAEILGEAMPDTIKTRYEAELYQHSNVAKYRVDAGMNTKENMNKWLKEGSWFKSVEGRMPTPEDKEGVDIEKYLIK